MPPLTPQQLTPSEQQLIGDFCVLASRLAVNDVWIGTVHSATLGAPICLIVGVGEQAQVLQSIVMQAAVPNSALVEHVSEHHGGF